MTIVERQLWTVFLSVNEIGSQTFRRILKFISYTGGSVCLNDVWQTPERFSDKIRFTTEQLSNLKLFKKKYSIKSFWDHLQVKNIQVITELDSHYPPLLLQCEDRPVLLFVKGDTQKLLHPFPVAVVGTRRITGYGESATTKIVSQLVDQEASIISGLMYGVDSHAHAAALNRKGVTIGVLGYGFDHCYPQSHKEFIDNFLDGGGVIITPWSPNVPPTKGNFIARNRIVAGMSLAIVVTEATNPSGTFHTVNFGLEYNRNIYAVPGPITSAYSEGTKTLLNQGALLVSSAQDIMEDLRLQTAAAYRSSDPVISDPIQAQMYTRLKDQPMSSDDLCEVLHLDMSVLNSTLSMMEILGLIKQSGEVWMANIASSDP